MRVRPQCKNIQFTVIALSINVTDSHKHFHFCIKVHPEQAVLSLKYRMSAGASDRQNTVERETINRIQRKNIHCAEISVVES